MKMNFPFGNDLMKCMGAIGFVTHSVPVQRVIFTGAETLPTSTEAEEIISIETVHTKNDS